MNTNTINNPFDSDVYDSWAALEHFNDIDNEDQSEIDLEEANQSQVERLSLIESVRRPDGPDSDCPF